MMHACFCFCFFSTDSLKKAPAVPGLKIVIVGELCWQNLSAGSVIVNSIIIWMETDSSLFAQSCLVLITFDI